MKYNKYIWCDGSIKVCDGFINTLILIFENRPMDFSDYLLEKKWIITSTYIDNMNLVS